jgi:hypothetical protein
MLPTPIFFTKPGEALLRLLATARPHRRDLLNGQAGSPQHPAESSSSSYGPTVRLQLLSTTPRNDAVTFSYYSNSRFCLTT